MDNQKSISLFKKKLFEIWMEGINTLKKFLFGQLKYQKNVNYMLFAPRHIL